MIYCNTPVPNTTIYGCFVSTESLVLIILICCLHTLPGTMYYHWSMIFLLDRGKKVCKQGFCFFNHKSVSNNEHHLHKSTK